MIAKFTDRETGRSEYIEIVELMERENDWRVKWKDFTPNGVVLKTRFYEKKHYRMYLPFY